MSVRWKGGLNQFLIELTHMICNILHVQSVTSWLFFVSWMYLVQFNLVRSLTSKHFMKMNECDITKGDAGHETVPHT